MAEEQQQPSQNTTPITPEEFTRFSQARRLVPACPACGTSRWTIVDPPPNHAWSFTGLATSGGYSVPPPAVPSVLLACDNCYFIRPHAFFPIRKWLDENPEAPKSSNV